MNPQDALVSVWAQNNEGRYQNYKSTFTILDIPQIDKRWLWDLENGNGYESQYVPKTWKRSGRDIVEILYNAGIGSVELLKDWLTANF